MYQLWLRFSLRSIANRAGRIASGRNTGNQSNYSTLKQETNCSRIQSRRRTIAQIAGSSRARLIVAVCAGAVLAQCVYLLLT